MYSPRSFCVTVENLLLDYAQRVELGDVRARVELEALRGVRLALEGSEGRSRALRKREALVLLGRHWRPPGRELLRLRERVQRGELDDRSAGVPLGAARETVTAMIQVMRGAELEAWRRAGAFLDRESVAVVHVGALLRFLLVGAGETEGHD